MMLDEEHNSKMKIRTREIKYSPKIVMKKIKICDLSMSY